MSEPAPLSPVIPSPTAPRRVDPRRLKRRHAQERRFRTLGIAAIGFSAVVLLFLLVSIAGKGIGGFQRYEIRMAVDPLTLPVVIPPGSLSEAEALAVLDRAGLPDKVAAAARQALGPDGATLIAPDAWREIGKRIIANPSATSSRQYYWVPASDEAANAARGQGHRDLVPLVTRLEQAGTMARRLDGGFLTRADATSPQMVGIWGALKGSLLTMAVTLALAFPIGIFAALYLEEYAPQNRWTDLIEISINNLAAVPSIIFGLLGLAVFLGLFPNYRSAPLIGGMTLALMTMPVIVISGRNAIKAVPPSIRDAALAIGASRVQVVFHHVLPLALPGILTGTIIGMARALGETAPLLMIGMRAFVATPPDGITAPSSVLPVQIFLWSDEVDRGFIERTSAAIIILLLFLLAMNALAIYLRSRFEKRW